MWRRLICFLRWSHRDLVTREPGVLFLKCTCCGRRTAGWSLIDRPRPARDHTLRLLLDRIA
jgi:hypothetical protein